MRNPNQDAIKFAENRNKKVAPSLVDKAKIFGAGVLLAVGSMIGIDKANDSEVAPRTPTETSQDMGREAGKLAGTEVSSPLVDPATKEQAIYENSEAFANSTGSGAVKAEREANNQPETEIGDAVAAVKGPNGETIYVDPATGEAVNDQPEG